MAHEITYSRGVFWKMLKKLIRAEHPEWDEVEVVCEVLIAECGMGDYAKFCNNPKLIIVPILEALSPDEIIAPLTSSR